MFNQKVNYYSGNNPDYLNRSYGAPDVTPLSIHNCGVTIEKYKKSNDCERLPLQEWCSKHVSVEAFGMRPIVSSTDYFQNIKKYLSNVILNDYKNLKNSGLANEEYSLVTDNVESSFLQTIQLEVVEYLNILMAKSAESVTIFSTYNPISEGFVITDISVLNTYQSNKSMNHFYHSVIFSAVNTTRYNTVTFKAELYQDTTPILENWNKAIGQIKNSLDVQPGLNNSNSIVYVYLINLVNDVTCVLGQETDCSIKGYDLKNAFQNNLEPAENLTFLQNNSITDNTYTPQGNYSSQGQIKIVDYGPDNIDNLIKDLGY